MWMPNVKKSRVEELMKPDWRMCALKGQKVSLHGWSDLAGKAVKLTNLVRNLYLCSLKTARSQDDVGGISLKDCEVQNADASVALLRVGVDKLKDNVCAADDILRQDVSVAHLSVWNSSMILCVQQKIC